MNRLKNLVVATVILCIFAHTVDPFAGLASASPAIDKEPNTLLKRACPCTSKHAQSDCLSVPGFQCYWLSTGACFCRF
ncbi:MAG: hypothetical protein BYD32DRAFT_403730 [Podila humilis]|nr:MAG: hypothetical protein BYD32DRAFT_403730 [Podila humilis]